MPSYGGGTAGIIVSGQTSVVRPTIVVDADNNYADGDSVGGLITLSSFSAKPQGSGWITRICLQSIVDISVLTFLHIFDGNPADSTFTDNAALVIHANDRAKKLKTFSIAAANWADPVGASPFYTVELLGADGPTGLTFLQYKLAGGDDLYMAMESDGAINFAAVTDLSAIVAVENN